MKKTLTCADCRVEFTYDHLRGPTRQRCDSCTAARTLARQRASSLRYREANPQRTRDQWNKYNRKRLADPEHLRWKREDAARRAYGLEPADIQAMRDAQGDLCAICKGVHFGSWAALPAMQHPARSGR